MSAKSQPTKNYRQLSEKLENMVAQFDDPNIDIDKSIELYESASKVIAEMEAYLKQAKNKVEKINKAKN